jgi:hypothetical protein
MTPAGRFWYAFPVLAALLFLPAVRSTTAGDDWLAIPPADLALKDNPAQPGAHAMILYRESAVNSTRASVDEYYRIKIFTEEGTKSGDVEIPFLKGNTDIKDIRGRTIQPNGKITVFDGKPFEKTVVKASGYKFLAKTFTLPDVHPGCIIEYKYRDQGNPAFYYNNSWVVSQELFTRDARFSIAPFAGRLALLYREIGLPPDATPQRQPNGSFAMEIHNIMGIQEEELMPPETSLQARVEFFYADADTPDQETVDHYWNRLGKKWSSELDAFVNKKGALEKDLSQTVSATDAPEVRLQKIYSRVQKLRNLSMEEAKTEKEGKQEQLKPNLNVEDVLKHGYATALQMNYTFVGLARAAGFTAAEVFVAPRNHNFFSPKMRDSDELGANIVWIRAGTKEYYLDPAASYFRFGLLPWYETDTNGLRISKEGAEIVSIPPSPTADATMVRHAALELDEDGLASGKLDLELAGQSAAIWREDERREDETGRKKAFENKLKEWLPAGSSVEVTSIKNWEDNALPIRVEATAKIPNFGTSAGRRLLVPVSPFQAAQASAFSSQRRVNDIYFSFPNEEVDEVSLQSPDTYKIETLPQAKPLHPGPVSYEISVASKGNSVEVKRHLVLGGMMFPVKSYPALRSFFNSVKSNDDAQVVFQHDESAKNN